MILAKESCPTWLGLGSLGKADHFLPGSAQVSLLNFQHTRLPIRTCLLTLLLPHHRPCRYEVHLPLVRPWMHPQATQAPSRDPQTLAAIVPLFATTMASRAREKTRTTTMAHLRRPSNKPRPY